MQEDYFYYDDMPYNYPDDDDSRYYYSNDDGTRNDDGTGTADDSGSENDGNDADDKSHEADGIAGEYFFEDNCAEGKELVVVSMHSGLSDGWRGKFCN
jgi:hypothetical protein